MQIMKHLQFGISVFYHLTVIDKTWKSWNFELNILLGSEDRAE